MSDRPTRRGFATRPADPERWVRTAEAPARRTEGDAGFTARLTIDVTPDQRGRIKIAAFRRGITVADMLRELLAREFPPTAGDQS
ncbi:ribbon-helix-helix protein [Sphingomonas adhaesiva]|uniref:ribbon-helix-helix protein n=1 Tax=Sphingomonas adhaesiva TaxID=28212 RepID=UPI002FF7E9ED